MTIQLHKNQGINLSKDHGLSKVVLEVTYDIDPSHPVKKHQQDVGVMAFEVSHASGKALCPQDECFVFYNCPVSATGAITHSKDGGSVGKDFLTIDLDALTKNTLGITEVSCFAEIYEGFKTGVVFGNLTHCTAHVINPDNNEVIAEFKLTDEDSKDSMMQMGSLVIDGNGHWTFKAVGVGYVKGLEEILEIYGLQASDEE